MTTEVYSKTRGRTTMKGELFEVKTAALLYLRGINGNLEFRLGSNIEQARNFDDIVLKYRSREPGSQWYTCFIQLKHKERGWLDTSMLTTYERGGFSLQKYLKSFCDIKSKVHMGSDHDIFNGPFETCDFVIYTNAPMVRDLADRQRNANSGPVKELLKTSQRTETIVGFCEKTDRDIYKALEVSGGPVATEFLRKLTVFAGQPSEDKMDDVIKEELRVSCSDNMSDVDVIYRFFIDAVKQWWSEDEVKFLSHDSSLLEKALDQYKVFTLCSQEKLLYRLSLRFNNSSVERLSRLFESNSSVYFITCLNMPVELGCTKIMQVLRQEKGAYTFLSLQRLEATKQVVLHGWINGSQPHLVLYCNTTTDHRDLWVEMTSLLMENRHKHLVAVFKSEEFPTSLKSVLIETGLTFFEFQESCQLCDLDSESINKILESKLVLQGKTINLRSFLREGLAKAEEIVKNHLVSILASPPPKIGIELPTMGHGRAPTRYLERYDVLKPDILKANITSGVVAVSNVSLPELQTMIGPKKHATGVVESVYLHTNVIAMHMDDDGTYNEERSEEEFHKLCQYNNTVHWLTREYNVLRWKRSKGDVRTITYFTQRQLRTGHNPGTTLDLRNRVIVIAQKPAARRVSLVHYLGLQTKEMYPYNWVLIIDLEQQLPLIRKTPQENADPLVFLLEASGMHTKHQLQTDFFQFSLNHAKNVIVILDRYETLPGQLQVTVVNLIKKMMKTSALQVVMTTSWFTVSLLEYTFCTIAYYREKLNFTQTVLEDMWIGENIEFLQDMLMKEEDENPTDDQEADEQRKKEKSIADALESLVSTP